jgi:hypothetical protein
VEALLTRESPHISPLAAGIVVAVDLGIADSRSFSRALGVEHALVLREIAELSGPDGLITVTARNEKTLRTSLVLSARGAALVRGRAAGGTES